MSETVRDPFLFLSKWFPYSISLFAAMADLGVLLSGSTAVSYYFPERICHTKGSDFDFYAPKTREGIITLMQIFNISGVKWHNKLSDQLSDLAEHKETFVSLLFIQAISRKVFKNESYSKEQLEEYLTDSLKAKSKIERKFIAQFCDLCESYFREHPYPEEKEKHQVWVFNKDGGSMYCPTEEDESNMAAVISLFHEDQSQPERKSLLELKRSWIKQGYNEELFIKYITYRLHRILPWIDRKKIAAEISVVLNDMTRLREILDDDTDLQFLRLDDFVRHEATLVPLSLIRSIFQRGLDQDIIDGLTASFEPSSREKFVQFCTACEDYVSKHPQPTNEEENQALVFYEQEGNIHRPTRREESIMKDLICIFRKQSKEDPKICLADLKILWGKEKGKGKRLFVDYVTYRVYKAMPEIDQEQIRKDIIALLKKDAPPLRIFDNDTDLQFLHLDKSANYNSAFVPLSVIRAISLKVDNGLCPKKDLQDYLFNSLKAKSAMKRKFIAQFCDLCENYFREHPYLEQDETRKVWIFNDGEGSMYRPTEEEERFLRSLIPEFPQPENQDSLIELKIRWMKRGYNEKLFVKYVTYRVHKARPSIDRNQIMKYINMLLREENYGLQIVQGQLNGRGIQLIIFEANDKRGQGLRTILRFYASHVMSFISGTVGAHLYYSTAKDGKSWEWDFEYDPRQKFAELAIAKMKLRGWEFIDSQKLEEYYRSLGRNVTPPRREPGDEHGKIVEFQEFYKQAYKEVKNVAKPSDHDWEHMMKRQRNELETYSWTDRHRRISSIKDENKRRLTSSRISEWVRGELKGHQFVIKEDMWTEESRKKARMDLYFSRAGNLFDEECQGYNRL